MWGNEGRGMTCTTTQTEEPFTKIRTLQAVKAPVTTFTGAEGGRRQHYVGFNTGLAEFKLLETSI